MAKKNKSGQPNAPELQQILFDTTSAQQPPHNPYYPDLGHTSHMMPPPPYTGFKNPIQPVHMNSFAATNANYSQMHGPPATVIIQHPSGGFDRRAEKYHNKVRKYNCEMLLVAVLSIVLSLYARSLYERRPCVDSFLVHQPTDDITITIKTIRDMQVMIAFFSVFVLLVTFIKGCCGRSKSYSCYLFVMGLSTALLTLYTGYITYLAFYSPCSLKPGELLANTVKTVLGQLEKMPSPDRGVFRESNVIQLAKEDGYGAGIFFIDLSIFIMYLASFISATTLC